jgi:hypothetical protein
MSVCDADPAVLAPNGACPGETYTFDFSIMGFQYNES